MASGGFGTFRGFATNPRANPPSFGVGLNLVLGSTYFYRGMPAASPGGVGFVFHVIRLKKLRLNALIK